MISRRQAIILFLICTMSSKLQLLPCLLAGEVERDLWIVLLFGAIIDTAFLFLTILINKLCPNMSIHDLLRQTYGKVVTFIIGILFFAYFICTSVLPFEAVRDVFASNLFDSIPWQVFALFFLICVGYLSFSGLRTLGRTAELYFYVILFSITGLILLGAINTSWSEILPAFQTSQSKICSTYMMHSIWFGDYMIFYVLTGRIKPGECGLKYKDILLWCGAICIYVLSYIVLWDLYGITTSSQASLLSSISAFSLLNLEIGRLDWFLVLFSQIASVVSCSTYIYCASECIYQLFGRKNFGICVIISTTLLYLADIIIFNNIDKGITFFTQKISIISFILQILIPLLCLISVFIIKKRINRHKWSKLC